MIKLTNDSPLRALVMCGLLAALTGCAVIPDLGEPPMPRADLTAASDGNLSSQALPKADWWKAYGDEQLSLLIAEGLQRAPSIDEAAARVRAADAVAQKAGASLLPTLDGDASYSRSRQSYNMGIDPAYLPHGYSDSTRAALNFSYELDFWGRNRDSVAAASSEAEAARLQLDQARILVATSIAAAYADLAQTYAELETAEKSASVRAATAGLFKERFDRGLENESGYEQAKAKQATAEAEVEALREAVTLTKNRLAALTGATPARALTIGKPQGAKIDGTEMPALMPADLISRRPDIQALRLKLEASAKRINVARAGFYPNLNLIGGIGQQSLSLENFTHGYSFFANIGPALHLPLFEGGKLQGTYRGARADYETAVAQYEGAIVQALRETADALASRRALAARTEKTLAALNASERAYKVAHDRYHGGLATYLEVLTAEDGVLQARRAVADIRARAFTLDVAMVKALGGGFVTTEQKNEDEE